MAKRLPISRMTQLLKEMISTKHGMLVMPAKRVLELMNELPGNVYMIDELINDGWLHFMPKETGPIIVSREAVEELVGK